MLAASHLQNFIQNTKCDKILDGHLFPSNNNLAFISSKDIAVVTIVEEIGDNYKLVALGALNKCNNNQVSHITGY